MGDTTSSDDIERAPARSATDVWLQRLMLLATLLAGGVAMAKNVADADLWGHVTFGMNALADRSLPVTASHTFTAAGYRWINHENLSELTLAVLTAFGGGPALLAFKCLLGLAILTLMIFAATRRSTDVTAICVVVLLVAVNLTANWTLRPQIFTYGWFALMVFLLQAAFARFRPTGEIRVRFLWAIAGVMFLWANSHGGFVAGYALFTLYISCRSLEALKMFGAPALKGVWRLALITFCVGLVTFLNPYGPYLHLWLLDSLARPRPEITEWVPLAFDNPSFWPFLAIAALSVASLAVTRERRDWTQIALLVVTAWQAIEHARHAPFFAILVGFWLPSHVDSLLTRVAEYRKRPAPQSQVAASRAVLTGMLLACIVLAAVLVGRTRQVRVNKSEFPVDAIHFMADNGLQGRLVVTYNWAQYALAALGPETTVAFDGRFRTCYPQAIVDMHFDLVLGDNAELRWRDPESPPFDSSRVLAVGQPDIVLIDRSQQPSVATMAAQSDWLLIYQDAIAQVWGRSSRFDNPSHPDYLPPHRRSITETAAVGFAAWPAFPQSLRAGAQSAHHVHGFPRNQEPAALSHRG